MRIFLKMMLVVSGFLFIGCGGGGGDDAPISGGDNAGDPQVYQNKKMPTIKNTTVPDILLVDTSNPSTKLITQYNKETSIKSSGFVHLKEQARFFYQKQLEMNIDLSYMDSVWDQIDAYCDGKNICNIPKDKIVFTYTKALYKYNIKLIKEYEEKTGDDNTYQGFEIGLKSLIGKSFKLSSAKLTMDENTDYKYELITENINPDEMMNNVGISIVKWNEDNSKYLVREENVESNGNTSYSQFTYTETSEEKRSKFTSNHQGFYDESLEFIEKDGMITFIQDEPNNDDMISYYAEGYLDDDGGKMTVVGAGETYSETFDSEGDILTIINCVGIIKDLQNIPKDASCQLKDPNMIKKIIINDVYRLSITFWGQNDFVPTSGPSYKSMVKFDENDTVLAIVGCSTFTANYKIGDYGISFSNILKTVSTDLKCLYPQIEKNFEQMLHKGLPFMLAIDDPIKGNRYYDVIYGFFPNLAIIDSASDFNMTKFNETLHSEMFVDSPLMNSVFKIKSVTEYVNAVSGKYFSLAGSPSIKVEENKMVIDLIDATFEADIEVLDPTHIKFVNINRVNKSNVIYPDGANSDKIFADVVEKFLNETIKVYLATTDYSFISFEGSGLIFMGSIIEPEPMVESLRLTIGADYTESAYRTHGEPIILADGIKDITNVSINKEGEITLGGADADLFTLNDNKLSFITEVNASNPIDENKDGIYELEIRATDNDSQTVRYDIWYKVYIPGTTIVQKIEDMVGIWDFSEDHDHKHYLEILSSGAMKVYDYNNIDKCFESDIAGIAIKEGTKEGVFEEYTTSSNMINHTFTAEIRNDTLIRTHVNNFNIIPDRKRATESASELAAQKCS